jgi:predicted DNA repair protein MutK
VGFSAARELPIIRRIAIGSLRNKLLILLPAALALSALLPAGITPLLMLGGAYLCYEGVEKVYEAILPHHAHAHEGELGTIALSAETLEDEKVAGAIKTDFILSAEIMAITLAAVPEASLLNQAVVLALVGLGITVVVYGVVAAIVKADDVGMALAGDDRRASGLGRAVGRALVRGMPGFLAFLGAAGTAAMIWVGGGIIVHGLETYGLRTVGEVIHALADAAGHMVPPAAPVAEWIVTAAGYGVVGVAVGAACIPLAGFIVAPAWRWLKRALGRRERRA